MKKKDKRKTWNLTLEMMIWNDVGMFFQNVFILLWAFKRNSLQGMLKKTTPPTACHSLMYAVLWCRLPSFAISFKKNSPIPQPIELCAAPWHHRLRNELSCRGNRQGMEAYSRRVMGFVPCFQSVWFRLVEEENRAPFKAEASAERSRWPALTQPDD